MKHCFLPDNIVFWSTMVSVKRSNKLLYQACNSTNARYWCFGVTIKLGHLVQNILLIKPLIVFIKDGCFVCISYFHTICHQQIISSATILTISNQLQIFPISQRLKILCNLCTVCYRTSRRLQQHSMGLKSVRIQLKLKCALKLI